jgi:2-phospho-L-lactate guanylyltransferase (CobY/MobA/RfbA family)
MKPNQMYQSLKELAEKLDVTVSEQNLRSTGIKVKSGICRLKGKNILIVDSQLPFNDKNEIIAACLSKFPHENVFMVPALRDFLNKHSDQ